MPDIQNRKRAARRLRAALLASTALVVTAIVSAAGPSRAQDATWLANPGSNVFNTGTNWDTGSVPTGTAYFGATNTPNLSFMIFGGGSRTLGGWTFNAGAADYTFTTNNNNTLTFTGVGIVINGGSATITNNGLLLFQNSSTAGGATINNTGSGQLQFADSSSAGTAVINNGDSLEFYNTSTAGNANIANGTGTLNFYANSSAGNATIANQNLTYFNGYSTAGNATITNDGGISFQNFSTGGNATITNNGGLTFRDNSTAAGAAIINNASASIDFSSTTGLNGDNKISAGSIAGAGNYGLGANELTVGSNNLSTEVSGVIGGTGGSLVKIGTGTLTLSGANTYTGGTTINGGMLQLGSASGVGSILGTVTVGSSGAFNVFNADTSGITAITNGGLLNFRNTSTAGSATITNRAAAQLNFNNASTAGSATIANNSTGSVNFNQTSTAGTATITNDGSLNFNDTSTAGSATITNRAAAQLNFNNASTAGSATITNNNIINFNTVSTAGNATITNNYGLMFFGASTAGSAVVTNTSSGQIIFMNTSTAGSSVITNGYAISFLDTTTAGGAVIVNNATLQFADSSTAGSATITNNGTLGFFVNGTGGNASILNNAVGTVDFSHSTGPAGDGKLSVGSIAGAGNIYLGARELTIGSNNQTTTVSGAISDCGANGAACYANIYSLSSTGGSLVKTGTGTLTLSGTNTYTGATTVNGGTLAVNGSLTATSSITVNSGGALGGTGTVRDTTIASGGALAPGNSIGTLTVNGNLTFNAGGFYRVEVSPTAADRTNVTGIATLTGATVQAVALAGSFRAQTYTILNATGGFGGTQFAGLTGSSFVPGARNPHLTYDTNNVYLVLDPGTLQLPAGASGNQTKVAGAINNFVENGGTPPAAFDVLLNMSNAQLTNALNQVSGQPGAAGTQSSFNATQQFMAMLDPASGHGGGPGGMISYAEEEALGYALVSKRDAKALEAYAAVTPRDRRGDSFEGRWGVWASGYGGASTVSGSTTSGASTTTSRVYGTVVGADYRVSPDTLIGFALGGAGFNVSLSDGLGGGRADLFQAGLYGRHSFGAAYVSASLAYGWQDVTTDRTVTVSGTDKLTANYKASTFAARAEAGYRFAPWPIATFGVTPYAALQVTSFHLPGYRESATSGSSTFALSYNAQTTTNVRTELGARFDKPFLVADGLLTLRSRLAWAHDSNTDRPVTAAFQALPGASFTVNGARPAADAALVSAGAEMAWLNGLSLAGTFEGEFSNTTQTYAGKGTVRYAW